MPYVNYDQSNFSNGVLDPKAYARTDYDKYYKSVKQAKNALVIPQGGITRRFGTKFVFKLDSTLGDYLHPQYTEISTLTYDDSAIYLLVWQEQQILIFLENILAATVVTGYLRTDIPNLRFAQVINRLIVANPRFAQTQLVRSSNAANPIIGFNVGNNTLTLTNNLVAGQILPVIFTIGVALPATTPQVVLQVTYYMKLITNNTFQIYSTPTDAANSTNVYIITNGGNAAVANVQNTWTFSAIQFIAGPAFDYDGGYANITFTPSATSGNITLTSSGNIFTAAMANGLFTGAGGAMRITGFTNATTVTGFTIANFPNTNPIMGSQAFLGEPAWSGTRGFPGYVSFFQNRLVFAGSPSNPNGVWLSNVNGAFEFDDSQTLPDNAISWYPAAGTSNVVRALTPGKTLTVHTNTGNYTTPFATEQPLTPTNFALIEQNKDGIANLQPVFIDNQIIYVDKSGNNVKNMVYDLIQGTYTLNNISIASSSLIVQPVDMTAFTDPNFTDGYYVLFINNDGTLTIFQTLREQEIGAWTNADILDRQGTVTSGVGFQHVTSSINRVWFVAQCSRNVANAPVAIVGFNAGNRTLQANAHGMPVGAVSQVQFTTANALPLTVPPLNLTQYFYAIATNANNFQVFGSASDATANINSFTIVNAGVASNVVYLPTTFDIVILELDFNKSTDESISFSSLNSNIIPNLGPMNGYDVSVFADGVAQGTFNVFNSTVTLPQVVNNGYAGLPFYTTIQLLPIGNIAGTPSNLYKTKHIRGLYLNMYLTLGATIQGKPIIIPTVVPQQLTTPVSGVYLYGMMEDWDYTQYDITIQQVNPLPMTLIGVSYILELT